MRLFQYLKNLLLDKFGVVLLEAKEHLIADRLYSMTACLCMLQQSP